MSKSGSLWQPPRSSATSTIFPVGLRASNIFYSHRHSTVWLQPELPPGKGEELAKVGLASTYDDSGWCYVELTSSAMVKKKGCRLDLSKRGQVQLYSCGLLEDLLEPLTFMCESKRMPPIHPDDMKLALETEKVFTSKGDVRGPNPRTHAAYTPAWTFAI